MLRWFAPGGHIGGMLRNMLVRGCGASRDGCECSPADLRSHFGTVRTDLKPNVSDQTERPLDCPDEKRSLELDARAFI